MKRKKNEIQGIRKGGNSLHGRRTGALVLTLALVLGIFAAPEIPGVTNPAGVKVEAKSGTDKKKPTIKFSGKSQITVEKNEVIKIPETTAKDNKDGNVTKKISVTVKKGKTSYKSIATKIKKNKKVKFSSIGKYTVTYSVKDKAGNKATKKRYITVVEPKTENATTEAPTSQTTEIPTTTEMPTTTEIPTTTEAPTTEEIKKEFVDYNYTVSTDDEFYLNEASKTENLNNYDMKIVYENDYHSIAIERDSVLLENNDFIKYLGKITAYDAEGNDISDSIIISVGEGIKRGVETGSNSAEVYVYATDAKGNAKSRRLNVDFLDNFKMDERYKLITTDPILYALHVKDVDTYIGFLNKKLVRKIDIFNM